MIKKQVLKKLIIILLSLLTYSKTVCLDMVLQQRSEVRLMSQEVLKEQDSLKRFENTAQILAAEYTKFFVHPKDRNNAYVFAYNTLCKCMKLGTINHKQRQDWEKETEIPFAFRGISFNQVYSSQGNDFFDKISTSIIWLLMHAFEIHCLEGHSLSQTREFWNRILHWTSMARAAVMILSTEGNIPVGYEKDINQGFPGLFTTMSLKEPWLLSDQLKAFWQYLFDWNSIDTPSYYGGSLNATGHIRVFHSEAHASTIGFNSFQTALYLAFQSRSTKMADTNSVGELAKYLLSFIYDMSWSSTCERGQAAMMNWIAYALALWAGYDIELPDEDVHTFTSALQALNEKLPNKQEENLIFLKNHFSQPDVIALCSPKPEIFLQHYEIQLRKRDQIKVKTLGSSPFTDKLPKILDLSFQTISSILELLEHLGDGPCIHELRICNILHEGLSPSREAYLCIYLDILEKALLRCPNISKLVISEFSAEIIEKINRIVPNLETLELSEIDTIDGLCETLKILPITNLIIKNNHYAPGGYPLIFPEKGLKLLDNTLFKLKFLELPFGKIDVAKNGISLVGMPSFWKKMACLEAVKLTHSQTKCTNSGWEITGLPNILKLLSNCPKLSSIQVCGNPVVFEELSFNASNISNLANWKSLDISDCIQTLSLSITKLPDVMDQLGELQKLLEILGPHCKNLETLNLSYNNLHCFPGWYSHVINSISSLKTLYNTIPMSMIFDLSNSQNTTTLDLKLLDSKHVPEGTRYIYPNTGREIALYAHPLRSGMHLVRIPTGNLNNWCAIYALGLGNNSQARRIIAQYNRAFIDVNDQMFWTQMADILNRPIEIYRSLDFGRPDPLNGTLELVARYGNSTDEPRRIFARFGHYNALLDGNDPDAIIRFMNNQSDQGELAF